MSERLMPSRDDKYENIAMAFQRVMVMEVDEALKQAGIKDGAIRRKVCENFSSGMGDFLDQYWFEAEGVKYYPLLCFSETFLDTDTDTDALGPLHLKSPSFSFHELSGNDVESHFADIDGVEKLKIGLVGEDEPMHTDEE